MPGTFRLGKLAGIDIDSCMRWEERSHQEEQRLIEQQNNDARASTPRSHRF